VQKYKAKIASPACRKIPSGILPEGNLSTGQIFIVRAANARILDFPGFSVILLYIGDYL